jgi:hypothetical protein
MKTIQFIYLVLWLIPATIAVTYIAGYLHPCGTLAAAPVAAYTLETFTILLTLFVIYFAIRIFNFSKVRKSITEEKNTRVAHVKFVRWTALRIVLLFVAAMAGLLTFLLTLKEGGAYCTTITLIAALFCFPQESTFRKLRSADTPAGPEGRQDKSH